MMIDGNSEFIGAAARFRFPARVRRASSQLPPFSESRRLFVVVDVMPGTLWVQIMSRDRSQDIQLRSANMS